MTKSSFKLILPHLFDFSVMTTTKLNKYLNLTSNKKKPSHFFSWSLQPVLLPKHGFKRVSVYNGRFFVTFQVRNSMLYNNARALVRTKKLGPSIHFLKKKKK